MPNIKSAKKALRNSARRRVENDRRRKDMRSVIKDIKSLVSSGEAKTAQEKLSTAYKAIDKASKKGIIKKNNASRKKSRLASLIKKSVS